MFLWLNVLLQNSCSGWLTASTFLIHCWKLLFGFDDNLGVYVVLVAWCLILMGLKSLGNNYAAGCSALSDVLFL